MGFDAVIFSESEMTAYGYIQKHKSDLCPVFGFLNVGDILPNVTRFPLNWLV